jgi:hypothetical protein
VRVEVEARLTLAGLHDEGKAGRDVVSGLGLGHFDVEGGIRKMGVKWSKLSG